jgi:transposase-like protein
MSKRIRRNYTSSQKLTLLKRHHLDKVAVSDLCDEAQLQPSVFYSWQHRLFENGAVAFEGGKRSTSREQELAAQVAVLEARLATKDSVIAEISAEFVQLKKKLGDR